MCRCLQWLADLPPVRVGRTCDQDDPLVKDHDKDTWIALAKETGHPTYADEKPVAAEGRNDVRDQLKTFIDNFQPVFSVNAEPDKEVIKDMKATAAACDSV